MSQSMIEDQGTPDLLRRALSLDEAQQVWADLEHIWRQTTDKAMAREAKKAAKYLGLLIDRREAIDQQETSARHHQKEAADAGRQAEQEGRAVIYLHGRPFPDPATATDEDAEL